MLHAMHPHSTTQSGQSHEQGRSRAGPGLGTAPRHLPTGPAGLQAAVAGPTTDHRSGPRARGRGEGRGEGAGQHPVGCGQAPQRRHPRVRDDPFSWRGPRDAGVVDGGVLRGRDPLQALVRRVRMAGVVSSASKWRKTPTHASTYPTTHPRWLNSVRCCSNAFIRHTLHPTTHRHPVDHQWCVWDAAYHSAATTDRPARHFDGKRWAVRETVGGATKTYLIDFVEPQDYVSAPFL